MIAIVIAICVGASILLRTRWWALHFPFWYAFFPKGFVLLDVPGLPVVTMYRFICIALFLSMSLIYRQQRGGWIKSSPTFGPMMILLIASFITLSFTLLSPHAGALQSFNIFNEIIVPVSAFGFYFARISNENQRKFFSRVLLFYGLISVYAVVSYAIDFNPYVEFLKTTTHTGRIEVQTYAETLRGLRAQGTISHPITFGASIAIILLSVASAGRGIQKNSAHVLLSPLGIFSVILIVAAMSLTKSRSPLIFLGVAGIVAILKSSFFYAYWYIVAGTVFLTVSFVFVPGVDSIILGILNIIDPTVGDAQYGSNLEMRQRQLEVSLRYFVDAPFAGNGLNATRDIVSSGREPDLYDSESLLFSLLINQGLIGIFAYIISFVWLKFLIGKVIHDNNVRAIAVGTLAGYGVFILATGVMGTLPLFFVMMSSLLIYHRKQSVHDVKEVAE